MNITLKRINLTETYTEGKLFLNGKYFADTIEDKVRDLNKDGKLDTQKVYGKTAIPYGTYKVTMSWSNKFQKTLPEVKNVPEFSGIRIHSGNSADDSLGCILVGQKTKNGWISNSRVTCSKLYNEIQIAINKKENVTLTII